MTDKIFQLLNVNPLLSVIFGFVLAVLAMFLLKNELRALVKKKFNLYSEDEIKSFGRYIQDKSEIKNQQLTFNFEKFNTFKNGKVDKEIEKQLLDWKSLVK